LLAKDADVNVKCNNGDTALILAAEKGHKDIVEALLVQGADVNAKGRYGDAALICAAQNGHTDIVRALLAQGADVNAQNKGGDTALILAAYNGHKDIVKALLDKGADIDVNAQNKGGDTALIWAAHNGHTEVVQALLAKGVNINVNAQNKFGNTALIVAAAKGHTEVVNVLLDKGADIDVNAQNKGGDTALILAAYNGHTDIVQALLAQGADCSFIKPSYKDYGLILKHLVDLDTNTQAKCLRNMPGGSYADIRSYVTLEKPMYFNSLFIKPNASHETIKKMLSEMNFDEHINRISEHYVLMHKKSLSNSNYTEAVVAAKNLLIACGNAKQALFEGNATVDEISLFKTTCEEAIEKAKPVLEKHREWVKVLAEFLLAVITLPLSFPLYALGLFSAKTTSEQLIDKLNEAVTVNPKNKS